MAPKCANRCLPPIPLNSILIGAHEYEGHHLFDLWYRNTSDIVPTAITGDMHSVNRANFAILHWFGLRFEPRFTDLDDQLKELSCADTPTLYEKCLIRPVGQIDLQVIIDEKPNTDRIVATLGLKEMTQGTLIRKLCTYTAPNPTRRWPLHLSQRREGDRPRCHRGGPGPRVTIFSAVWAYIPVYGPSMRKMIGNTITMKLPDTRPKKPTILRRAARQPCTIVSTPRRI
jgi:Tn3 transposase DDE domain